MFFLFFFAFLSTEAQSHGHKKRYFYRSRQMKQTKIPNAAPFFPKPPIITIYLNEKEKDEERKPHKLVPKLYSPIVEQNNDHIQKFTEFDSPTSKTNSYSRSIPRSFISRPSQHHDD